MSASHCLNCNAPLHGGQKFCSVCGQKADTHRLTLPHFFHEFFHAFTHTDKSIFHLLGGLATKPGVVAREYVTGKRKKYFNPFTFFILLTAIYVLSNQFFTRDAAPNSIPASIQRIPNEQAKQKAIAMYQRGMKVRTFTRNSGNILAMAAIPVIAFVFWGIFRKRNFTYAEHLTANVFFISFANLAFSAIVYPLVGITGLPFLPWGLAIAFSLQAAYFTWAYSGFFADRSAWTIIKLLLVSILSLFVWALVSQTAMAIYIYQGWDFYQFFARMSQR
jgi:hypothetical protein